MSRTFTILIFILLGNSLFFAQAPKDISRIFSKSQSADLRALDYADDALTLEMNTGLLKQSYLEGDAHVVMTIVVSETKEFTLDLYRFNIFNENFILRSSSGDTLHDYKRGLFYTGMIRGSAGFATISIFEDEFMGIISPEGAGNYNVVRIEGTENKYVVYDDFKVKNPLSFECNIPDNIHHDGHRHDMHDQIELRNDNCVKFYLEGDYELFQDKGSVQAASDYLTALFAQIAILYSNEGISIEISEIMIWDTPDNYTDADAGDDLQIFINNNPTFNGDLASLMSVGGSSLGGLAYVDVLCLPAWSYSFNGINGSFNNVPTFSWDVQVCAHEWGHNFGSQHTHACVWNGNNTQIDDCGNQYSFNNGETPEGNACFDSNNPILPSAGTIMSYCHLISGIGISFTQGFGPQPGDLIFNKYNNASCLTECTGGVLSPVADFYGEPVTICEGDLVYFTDLSSNDPTAWNWTFPGGTPDFSDEQNPIINYFEPGSFDVTLVASNAGGSDELTKFSYITVNNLAQPSFTYVIENGNTVYFTNTSQHANYFDWDFGDGNFSSEENPVHVYEEGGTYVVTLYAYSDNCLAPQQYSDLLNIIVQPVAEISFNQTMFCKPATIQFNDVSTGTVTSRLWTFEGGTPTTSTVKNPIVQYNETGTFNVSLTVSNSLFSDSVELPDTIKVFTTPDAGFTYSINSNIVSFTNTSANADSLLWDFGDGNQSTEENPVHTYASAGEFTVSLTATNQCGSDLETEIIVITLEPYANFTADDTTGCSPFSTTFRNLSNTSDVSWEFEGGTPATSIAQNPVVNYLNAGKFTVTLYATNANGTDTLIREDYIEVLPWPSGAFQHSVSGYTASFVQATNNITGFYWKFGDGNESEEVDPVHTYDEDGTYLVELFYYNECDTLVFSQTVVIANPPVAGFTWTNVTGCKPLTVTFTNTSSSNATSYNWSFPGGAPASSTEMNPVVTYNTKGAYNASLTVSNSVGSDTKIENNLVNVLGPPTPAYTFTNDLLEYTFTYTGETASQVQWQFGDGGTASGLQVSHTYASPGAYEVIVSATNDCGTDSYTQTINAALKPVAGFTNDKSEGCAPLAVKFTNTSTSANSVLWKFEGGMPAFSTDNNPLVTYTYGGEFGVQLIAFGGSNGNDTLIVEYLIKVDDGPEVDFDFYITGPNVSFNNLSSGDANTFTWDFGDGSQLSNEKNPVHTYLSNGNYSVKLFASNECGQKSKTRNVHITTVKVDELDLENMILYPNPNNGVFGLGFDAPEEGKYNFRVFNAMGVTVSDKNHSLGAGPNVLDFSLDQLPNGLYLIRISKDMKSINILFSKQ